jgi:hypothetical protein
MKTLAFLQAQLAGLEKAFLLFLSSKNAFLAQNDGF